MCPERTEVLWLGREEFNLCMARTEKGLILSIGCDYGMVRPQGDAQVGSPILWRGRGQTILIERERIKRQTIANRRLLHRRQAA